MLYSEGKEPGQIGYACFFYVTATYDFYNISLHVALPIWLVVGKCVNRKLSQINFYQ